MLNLLIKTGVINRFFLFQRAKLAMWVKKVKPPSRGKAVYLYNAVIYPQKTVR
jgi:hypothetical protein